MLADFGKDALPGGAIGAPQRQYLSNGDMLHCWTASEQGSNKQVMIVQRAGCSNDGALDAQPFQWWFWRQQSESAEHPGQARLADCPQTFQTGACGLWM